MKLVIYPDKGLKQTCTPVTDFDSSLGLLVQQMSKTMYAECGVGLAAPQVGINKRILVMDPSACLKSGNFKVLVNPKITWSSHEVEVFTEGCLSIPGMSSDIIRPVAIDVEYQDVVGQTHCCTFTGFPARIVQHEIDHLDGVLMLDRVPTVEHDMVYNKFQKMDIGKPFLWV